MIYYFAYGSNLHPLRLKERVPSASLVGVAVHSRHQLLFHKQSHDGSSKCNMFNSDAESDLVYGAIYTLIPEHKIILDKFEGKGKGYIDKQIELKHKNRRYTCFTYLSQQTYIEDNLKPYHWYKSLVILGAQYLGFPSDYIASIDRVESMEDPDLNRKHEQEKLTERIIKYRVDWGEERTPTNRYL